VRVAERVLVEKHGVGFVADLAFTVLVFVFLLLEGLLVNDLLVVQVHVKQDLLRVLLQQICVGSAAFEDAKGIFESLLKQVVAGLVRRLLLLLAVVLTKEDLWLVILVSLIHEEPVDVLHIAEKS
jgi:hypothetical protein